MENKYIISAIVAGAISVITTLGYAVNRVNSSFNEMNQSLNGIYKCFAVDLPEVGKGLRELNRQFQKIDTRAAKIEGDLEQIGKQMDENSKKLIQILEK